MTRAELIRQEFFENSWRENAGLLPRQRPENVEDLATLSETEWSKEFEQLMRNRLIMGRFRYGRLHSSLDLDAKLRRASRVLLSLVQEYKATGDIEMLVDLANFAMVEYVRAKRAGAKLASEDDGKFRDK